MKHPHQYVREKDTVVFECNDGRWFFEEAQSTRRIRVGKGFCYLGDIIGAPYGSIFEKQKDQLIAVKGGLFPDAVAPEIGEAPIPETDNRHFTDTNSAQKLSMENIVELRETCKNGSEIIQEIVKNSETWESRTDFSKQKYLRKKQIKYMPRVRILRANASTLVRTYFSKRPEKIGYLREDSLAQILTYGHIHANAKVLVFETCMGLLTGAIAERMGGMGRIFSGFSGQQLSNDALRRFNFDDKTTNMIIPYPLRYIRMLNMTEDDIKKIEYPTNPVDEEELLKRQKATEERLAKMTSEQRQEFEKKKEDRKKRQVNRPNAAKIREWLREPMDSLIISTFYNPMDTFLPLFPLLNISRPFVIFHEFLEPLVELFSYLQKQELAINLQLSTTWTREQQVLPGRTHPEMTMSSCSGYILTGIKIDSQVNIQDIKVHTTIPRKNKRSRSSNRKK